MIEFGTLDVVEGGKVPPPPTYLCEDGQERPSIWVDVTHLSYPNGRRLYMPFSHICDEVKTK